MPVYMIRAGEHGPVKIGYSDDILRRITKMQADNHEPLRVIRALEGGQELEARLHLHFGEVRRSGEWFEFREEMLTVYFGVPDASVEKYTPRKIPTVPELRFVPGGLEKTFWDSTIAFVQATGISVAAIGVRAVNSGNVIPRFAAGHSINLRTYKKIMCWYAANWPGDVIAPGAIAGFSAVAA